MHCTHLDQIGELTPRTSGCEECEKMGGTWTQLRVCLTCGHVGCCETSPGDHAAAHFRETGHAVMRSIEPGEDWGWCYIDQLIIPRVLEYLADMRKGASGEPIGRPRTVAIVVEPREVDEAPGVTIRRAIGNDRLVLLDPFLLLDHLTVSAEDDTMQTVGFPRHPHRGIETLTYVVAGHVHHKDSLGNDSSVGAGGAQWMRAGSGIFHEEYLIPNEAGCEALQIWLNLPAAQKMSSAQYHPASEAEVPQTQISDGAAADVVAGALGETHGPLRGSAVSPTYLSVHLAAGQSAVLPAPAGETTIAYLFRGEVAFGDGETPRTVTAPHLVIFTDGDQVEATATTDARFVFVHAKPLHEPVMQYRSLVMNTVEEMKTALEDLERGTFTRSVGA